MVRGNELILRSAKTNAGGEFAEAERVTASESEYATYDEVFGGEE